MIRRIACERDLDEGLAHLIEAEPRFAPLLATAGRVPLRLAEPGFAGLARIIISQQVSVASARAIWGRVEARWPALIHADIMLASDAELRACGLSGPKIATFAAIARAIDEGRLDLGALQEVSPEAVHAAMIAVRGIGPWTADIYCLFHLGHADAFAAGDLALQEGARLGFALPARPDARRMAELARAWSPWRGVAARLLWAYYAAVKARDGVPV